MSTYLYGGAPEAVQQGYADFVRAHQPPRRKPVRRGPVGGGLGDPFLEAILKMIGDGPTYSPLSDEDIRSKAQADVDAIVHPLLEREQANWAERLRQGAAAISGYTGVFADRVGALGPQVRDLFTGAGAVTQAAGNAAARTQQDAGMRNVHDLGAALEQMGAPHAKDLVGQQKGLAQNGARVTQTLGADEFQRLATEGGAEGSFYGKMPGVAGLYGGQYLRDYSTSLNNGLQDNMNEINSSVPALVRQLVTDYRNKNTDAQNAAASFGLNRAQLAATLYNSKADRDLNASIFDVKSELDLAKLTQDYSIKLANATNAADRAEIDRWYKQQKLGIDRKNATSSRISANASQTRANRPPTTKDPQAVAYAKAVSLASSHKTKYDSYGDPIAGTGSSWGVEYANIASYLRGLLPHALPSTINYLTRKALIAAGYRQSTTGAAAGGGGTTTAPRVP